MQPTGDSTENQPRRWWLAMLWSLAGRGAGQLYNGQPRRALLAFVAPAALLAVAVHLPEGAGTQIGWILFGACHLWILADAVATAVLHRRAFSPHRYASPWACLAFVLLARTVDTLFVGSWLVTIVTDPTGSMHPTIGDGDQVAVDLTAYAIAEPMRGDVIYFRSPVDDRRPATGRIIGLPGERVEIRDKQVFVEGVPLRSNWAHHGDSHVLWPHAASQRDHFGPLRVPERQYFVLSDNRDAGFDSRHWNRFVTRNQILGRADFIVWSRHPRHGVRWTRLGSAVHRDILAPLDADRATFVALGGDGGLPLPVAGGLALPAGLLALGIPALATRRRLALRRAAAHPYSSVVASPACASADLRSAGSGNTSLDDMTWWRLRHWDAGPRDPRHVGAQQDRLGAILQPLRVETLRLADLPMLRVELDRLAASRSLLDPGLRCLVHWRRAAVMHRVSLAANDVDGLREAVIAYRRAAAESHPSTAPLRWAAIQNDLGTALQAIGERQGSGDELSEAIAAYRAALGQRQRERTASDWATTQHNLGNALRARAERGNGSEDLEAAIAAYEAALSHRAGAGDPIGHAMTLNNLGVAARLLGARRHDPQLVERAVAAHRHAMQVLERCAPDYAAIPAGNLADDIALLQHLGLQRAA